MAGDGIDDFVELQEPLLLDAVNSADELRMGKVLVPRQGRGRLVHVRGNGDLRLSTKKGLWFPRVPLKIRSGDNP